MNALRTASGHPVSQIAFAPDGATFAAAQPHSGVTLHDRTTGAAVRTAGSSRVASYRGLVYFDDGTRLAASTPKGLEVFDVANDMAYALHHRHAKDSYLAANGPRLVVAWPRCVEVVEVPPPDLSPAQRGLWLRDWYHEALSPDGRFLAWVPRNNRLAVGLVGGRILAEAEAPGLKHPPVTGPYPPPGLDRVVFAPRGDRLAVRNGKTVSVFDMPAEDEPGDEGEEEVPRPHGVLRSVFQLPAPEKWPKGEPWVPPVAFTPNGRSLLVRRPKQQVQMWDVASGTLQAEWNWRLDAVTCLAVAPDAMTAVAGGRFGKVVVWDLE